MDDVNKLALICKYVASAMTRPLWEYPILKGLLVASKVERARGPGH